METKLLTEVYTVDFSEAVCDKYGLYYSKDYKRLLSYKTPSFEQKKKQTFSEIIIHPETEIICDDAFKDFGLYNSNKIKTKLVLPEGLKIIGERAFSHSRLSSITIPNSLTTILGNPFAFSDIPEIKNLSDNIKLYEGVLYNKSMSDVIHCFTQKESFISDAQTRYIREAAFARQYNLKTVVLSDVEGIGDKSFYDCPNLEYIKFSDKLYKIGEKAFKQKIADYQFSEYFIENKKWILKTISLEIRIPVNTKYIGKEAFVGITKIKSESEHFIVLNDLLLSSDEKVIYNCLATTKTIVIPESVECIMGSAFEGCQSIERLIITKNVKYIGNKAFGNCYELKSVYFESANVELGESVFSYCTNLKHITLPAEIKEIPYRTFFYCYKIDRIVFPESLAKIGEDAFVSCGFKELTMPKNLRNIGKYAFDGCEQLQDLILNDNLEEIEAFAFSGSKIITELKLPYSLKRIGTHSLNLQNKVTISNPSTSVGDYGLGWNIYDLIVQIPTRYIWDMMCCHEIKKYWHIVPLHKERTLSERLSGKDMGEFRFMKTDDYGHKERDEKKPGVYSGDMECFISLHDNYSKYTHETIKRIVLDKRVKYICNNAFAKYSCGVALFSEIKPIVLHDSIIAIGDNAFKYTSLKEIVLPKQLEYIGDYAFYNTFIDKITIPSNVTHIGKNPFACPYNMSKRHTEIVCESQHFKIVDKTLYTSDMKRLIYCFNYDEKIIIPDTVTSIDDYAFSRLPLKHIFIPFSVKKIGRNTFEFCDKLENINLNNVNSIGEGCFGWCGSLKTIVLPYIEDLNAWMFTSCKNLKSVKINNHTKCVKERTFKDCVKLSKITLTKNIMNIEDSAFTGSGLRKIICESSYFEVRDNTLYTKGLRKLVYCFSKKSKITIPEGVVEISNEAFANNNMKSVVFPPSIQLLGERLFDGCSNLMVVDFSKTNIKKLDRYTMMNCKSNPQIKMKK